jgi:hypothetical protein
VQITVAALVAAASRALPHPAKARQQAASLEPALSLERAA